MESTIQQTPIYGIVLIHMELNAGNYQHCVSERCGVIGDQLIGPYIFPQRLTGNIYASVLQHGLPALLENVPLQKRRQMCYKHNGAPPHFIQYLSPKPMDWSWRCTELATTVTGCEPIRLPCVGLHESYGVCTQGEHEKRPTPWNFQRCQKHQ